MDNIASNICSPGDLITTDPAFMGGHGIYTTENNKYASVVGYVTKVNNLFLVQPIKTRYIGDVGDVVVGRITAVDTSRWRVDINSTLDAMLPLTSVNLPGGELRRRSEEDERMMRHYFVENDLISAEVQNVHSDGSLSLHTRNLNYGKLGQGCLIRVSSPLIKRQKVHFVNLPCGVSIILGRNGNIWVTSTSIQESSRKNGGFTPLLKPVSLNERENISRICNCIKALAKHHVLLYDTSICTAFEISKQYQIKEILDPKIAQEIAEKTEIQLAVDS
ncbi:exosome complex component RRP4 [Brachionus plicatilis]|uniref:Exosome complex component RRP4 n=1 Tax=Brachionus plicatilis TaxID=10195 RepID=A0A3M7SR31_BRAPC|nr:exosome complex component RRP4 [Brachionus plicatilis]